MTACEIWGLWKNNTKRQFKNENHIIRQTDEGTIVYCTGPYAEQPVASSVLFNSKWQPYLGPMSFQDVLLEYKIGTTIYNNTYGHPKYYTRTNRKDPILDQDLRPITIGEILCDQWYIKEITE